MQAGAVPGMETKSAKLAQLYVEQFRLSAVKPGETIAIVSDLGTRREYLQASFAAAEALGADIYEMCVNSLPRWTSVGVPTIGQCKGALEAMSEVDLVVIFHVPLFSRWLKIFMDGGTRVLMVTDAPDRLQHSPGSRAQRGRHGLHVGLRRLGGHSAGGHYAALLAASARESARHGFGNVWM